MTFNKNISVTDLCDSLQQIAHEGKALYKILFSEDLESQEKISILVNDLEGTVEIK